MSINPVSFGKIFVIRYKKKDENTTQNLINLFMNSDEYKLMDEVKAKNITKIETSYNLCPDASLRISQNEIRFFTDNSYKEYSILKKIDKSAAEQYADKEAIRLYVEV